MNIVMGILKGIPWWVYPLFLFMVYRGIVALRPRETGLSQMVALPLIFFAWTLFGVSRDLQNGWVGYGSFFGLLLVGGGIGWQTFLTKGGVSFDVVTKNIRRPGTFMTLIVFLVVFIAKFVLSARLAMNGALGSNSLFCALSGGISGLADGLLFGGTAVQIWLARKDAPGHSLFPSGFLRR